MGKKQKLINLLILGLAFILRLVLLNQSFWLDEAIGALAVRDFSYKGIIANFLLSDNHPPLYYLVLKLWTDIFGYSEIAIRMPSVIFSVGTIYLAYLIAKKVSKNKTFPILASLFLATSPFHIYYSQEARMYAMAAFWAALAVFSFLKTFDQKQSKTPWIVFSFAITALIFTDYVPIFLLPVFWIVGTYKDQGKKWWLPFLISHLPFFILGLLWLPTFNIQREKGTWLLATLPSWKAVAGGATLKQLALVWMKFTLGRISFEPKKLYYLLVGAFSPVFLFSFWSAFSFYKKKKSVSRTNILLVFLWLFLPLFLGFFASFFFPAFIYFRFLYTVPAFYILLALGIVSLSQLKIRKTLLVLIFAANLIGLGIYFFDTGQQRENWRSAAAFVDSKIEKDEVVLFSYPDPFSPYRWYSQELEKAHGATNSISANKEKTQKMTKDLLAGKNGVYYFDYLSDLSDPERIVLKTIEDSGFESETVYSYHHIGFIRYYKKTK